MKATRIIPEVKVFDGINDRYRVRSEWIVKFEKKRQEEEKIRYLEAIKSKM